MFYPFVTETDVRLLGVEAGGRGGDPGAHAAPLSHGSPGVLHGSFSYVMQDEDGQTCDVHSISAGLDYPGVGPEHSYWKDPGRVEYTNCLDQEALHAFDLLARVRGNPARPRIVPCNGAGHACGRHWRRPDQAIVVCLSGRGDKDAAEIARIRATYSRYWP